MFIEENLTPWRNNFIRKLKDVKDISRVTTTDGKISFSTGGRRYIVNNGSDIINLFDSTLLPDEFYKAVDINPILAERDL